MIIFVNTWCSLLIWSGLFINSIDLGGAEKNFKDINEANDALSDPQKRARYDAGEDDLDGPPRGHGGFSEADIFAQMLLNQTEHSQSL